MYYCFQKHNILPSVFMNLSRGEHIVLRAFYEKEQEERIKAMKEFKEIFPVVDVSNM